MRKYYSTLPVTTVQVDASKPSGSFEWWRQSLGHGGINHLPLPEQVAQGISQLQPRLMRIFIQEFFDIYPAHGQFNWALLDPYMEALASTGTKIVAAITIKPKPLYPIIDQSIWMPNDVAEWKQVIEQLVIRYSVERPIVTHWEIGNEVDIGENGGCPYLIPDVDDYFSYYQMTIEPILKVFPQAQVGGPAAANFNLEWLKEFLLRCRNANQPLHFLSWHLYRDQSTDHAELVRQTCAMVNSLPGPRLELMITEWNKWFEPICVAEQAFEPDRAAHTAATILAYLDSGVDWTFYYHIWDQLAFDQKGFDSFFADPYIMIKHWNELPHRFALFGVNGEVRPQYFVYKMLCHMGDERLAISGDSPVLHQIATCEPGKIHVLLVNFHTERNEDLITTIHFQSLKAGTKMLHTYRIDAQQRWSADTLELLPIEQRAVDTRPDFLCQVFTPANSVTLLTLEDISI